MLFCSSTEDNAWTSAPGRTVLGVFFLQAAVNQVCEGGNAVGFRIVSSGSGPHLPAAHAPPRASLMPCHRPTHPPASPHHPHHPQASYRLNFGYPMAENLVCLFVFMLLASACLWRNLRAIQATWAEALLAPKGAKLRWGWGG